MRIEFSNFKAKVDEGTLVVDYRHEYRPYKDNADVVVVCNYLRNGEINKYVGDSISSLDYRKLFLDKVEEIRGLVLSFDGKEMEATPEALCEIPFGTSEAQRFVSTFIQDVAMHLLGGDQLTEDEVKNSD